uniref:Uncharacterized protein n=1 Tax=Anguilla anguilla TaxID=7936 RepID=A0A0E9PG96_ANGAN
MSLKRQRVPAESVWGCLGGRQRAGPTL